MNSFEKKQSTNFQILRKINKEENLTQRKLAQDLGFSLGKLNFILKELKKKGLVKISSLKKDPKKIRYILTSRGLTLRTKLTIDFMKRKMIEYDELKSEMKDLLEK